MWHRKFTKAGKKAIFQTIQLYIDRTMISTKVTRMHMEFDSEIIPASD